MKKIILTSLTILLASCSSTQTSDNLYSTSEVGKTIKIKSCTVLSSRQIIIRDANAGDKGEALGFFAGNISNSRSDRPLSGFITALVGGVVGRHVSDKLHEKPGVEYTVILRNGTELQLIQDIAENESILTTGDSCRLQTSGRTNRVISSQHFPNTINKPTEVEFREY